MSLIKFKRGPAANIAALFLEPGEPAITYDTGKLYVGGETGGKILINPDGGSATTAEKLAVARKFSIKGDATAPAVDFDGTGPVELDVTLANSGVTAGTYKKVVVDAKGRVTGCGGDLLASEIPNLTLAKITDAGTAASMNVGEAPGDVVIVSSNGKLSMAIIPDSLIGAMTYCDVFNASTGKDGAGAALPAPATGNKGWYWICSVAGTFQGVEYAVGDWIVSSGKAWSKVANNDAVTGVKGDSEATYRIGNVNISAANIGLGNVDNTKDATKSVASAAKLTAPAKINGVDFDGSGPITIADATKEPAITASVAGNYWNGAKAWVDFATSVRAAVLTGLSTATSTAIAAADSVLVALGKLQAQITFRAPLASPALTGTPTAPTAAASTNTTQIATCAFVKSQGYLDGSSVIDGGTF